MRDICAIDLIYSERVCLKSNDGGDDAARMSCQQMYN